jgi:hypothetical protein
LGQILSHADDFVIVCASRRRVEESLPFVSHWLKKLGLAIHPTKMPVTSEKSRSTSWATPLVRHGIGRPGGHCCQPGPR